MITVPRREGDARRGSSAASAINVGYRDQRYSGTYERIGRIKASFEWDQIPLYISDATRTLLQE